MNRSESSQPWTSNVMDPYAGLAALVAELDLCDAIHVGASTDGCGVARPVRRHGTSCAHPLAFIKAA